ncbi:MAG TPA: non-homologous end-joining DNA ligase [Syntrophorhabdaceae bacterium]|nr:non-homologous end-joining DNA ligase [Syntrophorhabdaceae bacterium]
MYATADDILRNDRSVASGRPIGPIKADPERKARPDVAGPIPPHSAMESEYLKDAPKRPMPHRIRPMLATLAKAPFDHPDWIFEVKWDGYRAIAEIHKEGISLYSRNLISFNRKFPAVIQSLRKLGFEEAVFDGEIVVVDKKGRADFQMLQDYKRTGSGFLLYYVFDLLYYEGHDLTGMPLILRKGLLTRILPSSPTIKLSAHVANDGILFFNTARQKGLEGIVAKHAQSLYRTGERSREWLKVKSVLTQEAVIAGFTEPTERRKYFGALVLGVFEGADLVFIGHTGSGFSAETLKTIRRKLHPLIRKKSPFKVVPRTNMPVTWVKPTLVCEVAFRGITREAVLRQPVFLRLREDKSVREVVREIPQGGDL